MTLKVLSQRYDRIWFYPFPDIGLDSEGFVETWLNRHGRLIEERIIFDFRWLIYEPILPCLDDVQHPLTYRLGETIWLRGYEIAIDGHEEREIVLAQPGDVLPLSLYWEATDRVEESLTVFVHLIDARHHVWAQKDSLPQLGDFPTDEWMPGDIIVDRYSIGVPSHIPPGGYLLVAGMYDPISGQRLPVFDDQGASQGDQTIIAQVQIK